MNVLHISPKLSPIGTHQLAADLAIGLQQMGLRNTVIAPPNELVGRMAAASVQHQSMRSFSLFRYKAEIKRISRIVTNNNTHTILSYTSQAAHMAWLACQPLPEEARPRIIGIHTTYPRQRGWRLGMECCDALVATSKHLRDELIRRAQLDAERPLWVIPYGANEELCNPSYRPSQTWLEQWQRQHPLPDGTLRVCLAGSITPLQGYEDIPTLLAWLKQANVKAHLYIVGDTARARHSYLNSLQKQIQTAEGEQRVTWLGQRSDLRDIISVSDVVLSLSRQPACHDRVILEALSLGKPVAAYDHGIARELLDTYLPEGRVNPGDIAGIADRLEQWQAYRPVLEGELLYPYRLNDTIRSIAELCSSVSLDTSAEPNH